MIVESNSPQSPFFTNAPADSAIPIARIVFNGLSFSWIDDETDEVLSNPESQQLIFEGSQDLQLRLTPDREIDPNHFLSIETGALYRIQVGDQVYSSESTLNDDWSFLCVTEYGQIDAVEKNLLFEFAVRESGSEYQLKSYWFDIDGSSSLGRTNVQEISSIADVHEKYFDDFDEGRLTWSSPVDDELIDIGEASFGETTFVFQENDSMSSLDVIAFIFGIPLYLKGLTETVTSTSHTIEYNGTIFDYAEVDGIITTVVRDGEFTSEFAAEIAESFPDSAGISYSTAVALIGQANMGSTLMMVAGADGNYVG